MIQTIFAFQGFPVLAMAGNEVPAEVRGAYRLLLLVCGMLLAVFALTILVARTLRRYRQTHLSDRPKPTANEDLWMQYRLPKDLEDDKPSDS